MKSALLFSTITLLLIRSQIDHSLINKSVNSQAGIPICFGGPKFSLNTDTIPPILYTGLGNYHFPTSTKDERAAKYFDQGLTLYYAFNHAEAGRSFKEAAKLDENMAMAYWGQALCMGPNINMPMDTSKSAEVFALTQKAFSLMDKCNEKEKALIDAITKRYNIYPNVDRSFLDKAYAGAMKKITETYPTDNDIAALYAEALMDLHPWDFWQKDGSPQPWTNEILTILENIFSRNPQHIGANHFYIHAVEASPNPSRALASANRLQTLVQGAGHLVHMPSHIYIQTGQYEEGTKANKFAISVDEKNLKDGMLSVAYPEHNIHFLYSTLTLERKSKEALTYAQKVKESIPEAFLADPIFAGYAQNLYATPVYALVRFGKWDEILKLKEPPKEFPFLRGLYHYAAGMANARLNRIEMATEHQAVLQSLVSEKTVKELIIFQTNTAAKLLTISAYVLEGEINASKKDYNKALPALKTAMELEEDLYYNEPADWPNPVKNNYGAVLLEAGRSREAEEVYLKALKKFPENSWALTGLFNSQIAQQKGTAAMETKKRLEKANASADFVLSSSRL
ncbi:tetratricopeptide repeat protein [Solitalea lacus]|uniref:tetratricopeptide repeat protein n=1 Tax=Solitalea lacus TaxID=2911172 RepID=UPI001EDB885B|nr:tetratricopeptide repeat protein [Solitalea lacus]UKJ07734.1 hypothetical protein L2B55_00880 [Solitalea lacus]